MYNTIQCSFREASMHRKYFAHTSPPLPSLYPLTTIFMRIHSYASCSYREAKRDQHIQTAHQPDCGSPGETQPAEGII